MRNSALCGAFQFGTKAVVEAAVKKARAAGASLVVSGLDLRRRDFAGTELVGVCFEDCLLDNADFTGSNLTSAVIRRGSAVAVKFRSARMLGVIIDGTPIRSSDFTGAALADADGCASIRVSSPDVRCVTCRGTVADGRRWVPTLVRLWNGVTERQQATLVMKAANGTLADPAAVLLAAGARNAFADAWKTGLITGQQLLKHLAAAAA